MFKDDAGGKELLLEGFARPKQVTIHLITESFDLEYEYSSGSGIAKISKLESPESRANDTDGAIESFEGIFPELDALDYNFSQGSGYPFGDLVDPFAPWFDPDAITDSQPVNVVDPPMPSVYLDQVSNIQTHQETSTIDLSTPSFIVPEIDDVLFTAQNKSQGNHRSPLRQPWSSISSLLSKRKRRRSEGSPVSENRQAPLNPLPSPQGLPMSPAFSRSGSIQSGTSGTSVTSGASGVSGVSGASGTSGRRGPLSEWARAGMNAVKKVGACWRCFFLRKKVSIAS